jgi:hypothetical protein
MRGVLRVRDEGKREKRVRDEAKVERTTTNGKRRSRRQSALVPFQSAMQNKMKIEKKQNTIFCTGNCCYTSSSRGVHQISNVLTVFDLGVRESTLLDITLDYPFLNN